jgi:DNA-binding CsgD family transcriptional regulator
MFNEACDFNVGKGMTILFDIENGYQTVFVIPDQKTIHPELLNILKIATNIYFEKKISLESKDLISKLTPREHEILKIRSEGFPYKVIADKLQISEDTIVFHTRNIRKKLDATSIDHAMFKFGFAKRHL